MLRLAPRVFCALHLRTSRAARLLAAPVQWWRDGVRPRSHRHPATRLTYLRQRRSFRPGLEMLETRELLSSAVGMPDLSGLRSDLTQLRNDAVGSAQTLFNVIQPSQTNAPTLASVQSQWSKAWNVLTADWNKSFQEVMSIEFTAMASTPLMQAIELIDNRFGQTGEMTQNTLHTMPHEPAVTSGKNASVSASAAPMATNGIHPLSATSVRAPNVRTTDIPPPSPPTSPLPMTYSTQGTSTWISPITGYVDVQCWGGGGGGASGGGTNFGYSGGGGGGGGGNSATVQVFANDSYTVTVGAGGAGASGGPGQGSSGSSGGTSSFAFGSTTYVSATGGGGGTGGKGDVGGNSGGTGGTPGGSGGDSGNISDGAGGNGGYAGGAGGNGGSGGSGGGGNGGAGSSPGGGGGGGGGNTNGSGGSGWNGSDGEVEIIPITVQFSSSSYSANETDGSANITVSLNEVSTQAVTVTYKTSAGSAVPGIDYNDTTGSVTIAAGHTRASFSILILDDNYANENSPETVNLMLSDPQNAILGANYAPLDINEDSDPLPTVQFSASTYSIPEGGGPATITATLSTPSAQTVTVYYSTSAGGTAIAGTDYTAIPPSPNSSLSFAPYVTSASFNVSTFDDGTASETSPETVNLTLSSPQNATLSPTQSTATLDVNEDSDPLPTVQFSASSYTVSETGGSINIPVTLSGADAQPVTVLYTTSDGTVKAGTDYTVTSGTLTFNPGQTGGTITVPILDDNNVNEVGIQDFIVSLSNPSNATLGSTSSAYVIIAEDNDNGAAAPLPFLEPMPCTNDG